MPYSGGESLEQKFIWVQRSCFFLHATLVACSDIEDSLGFKCQTGYSRAPWPVFSFFSSSTHDFSSRQWNDLWYLKQWRVFHSNYWTKNCLFPGYVFLFCFGLLLSRYWEILRAGGEWGYRWWDGWVVSLTQLVWVWANSGRRWRTGKPGVLQSIGLQRVGHNWTMNDALLSSDLEQSFLFDYLCCHLWMFSFLMLMSDDAAEEGTSSP